MCLIVGNPCPNLDSFQFSRMSIPPYTFPTVSLPGPVSSGGGTRRSTMGGVPPRVLGQDFWIAARSSLILENMLNVLLKSNVHKFVHSKTFLCIVVLFFFLASF